MNSQTQVHGSCAARAGQAVLLTGPPGSGKSDLVLRLLARGFDLVADDRVDIVGGWASAPPSLSGLLEVRGIGIVRLPYVRRARLALVVDLVSQGDRLPNPTLDPDIEVPCVHVDARSASAVERIQLALDCADGSIVQIAGAFEPEAQRMNGSAKPP